MGKLDGKVAIVTGAGRGIGRGEAISLAAEGAAVVVNDLGGEWQGGGADSRPANEVVAEITAAGGRAVANFGDVTDAEGADGLIQQAIDEFGRLDVLVNNAGILRDGMIFSIDPDEWFSVVNMHLKGHFRTTRAAAKHWRERGKAGDVSHRAIVNTTSESGLFGNAAQSNYDAAKMGIVSFTVAVARELVKYGVTCNAVAPRARTRLTMGTFSGGEREKEFAVEEDKFDPMHPDNIAPFVTFLATEDASDITAQTFIVYGGAVGHVKLPQLSDVLFKEGGKLTVEDLVSRRDELFKNIGPDHYEGPRGYARMPKQ
jgi:NAD(P)-dependent dehydrogenase (short-subunit alcohol dehydrogenase family)